MSAELQFVETEESQALLQDVLAFLDDNSSEGTLSPTSSQCPFASGDRKKKRVKNYSPDYERSRREKKKAERENLRCQVAQYETQLELLRLEKSVQSADSQWGWVHAATEEEDKRLKAEELNHQLRGLLVQQFNVANTFKNLMRQEAGFAQSILSTSPPCATPKKLGTFPNLTAIAAHLKGIFGTVRDSTDYVFESASVFREDANSLGALVNLATLKHNDPIAGSCIELLSSTPIACNMKNAASMVWQMLLDKEVFGPKSGLDIGGQHNCKHVEFKNSTVADASGALDGVTLMEKFDEVDRSVVVWTSMMVQPDGTPFFKSQVWVSVTKLASNPEKEAVVRICSRISGGHFGFPCDSAEINLPVARKHQIMAKSRQERVQLKIMERAELQNSSS
ncbi:hypothetical protein PHMEG_00031113 [Phytophthora megakarya]|uniref:M96 mating-specific protein n=1 Tax=Phytophthora megakarya TaxID=4795 RepID=A0A225UYJ2_9STRA|nr:hypothetical protein PHMEG_00031113 [Phytophthora megakarya]